MMALIRHHMAFIALVYVCVLGFSEVQAQAHAQAQGPPRNAVETEQAITTSRVRQAPLKQAQQGAGRNLDGNAWNVDELGPPRPVPSSQGWLVRPKTTHAKRHYFLRPIWIPTETKEPEQQPPEQQEDERFSEKLKRRVPKKHPPHVKEQPREQVQHEEQQPQHQLPHADEKPNKQAQNKESPLKKQLPHAHKQPEKQPQSNEQPAQQQLPVAKEQPEKQVMQDEQQAKQQLEEEPTQDLKQDPKQQLNQQPKQRLDQQPKQDPKQQPNQQSEQQLGDSLKESQAQAHVGAGGCSSKCQGGELCIEGVCALSVLQCLQQEDPERPYQVGSVSSVYGYDSGNFTYMAVVEAGSTNFTVALYPTGPARVDVSLLDGTVLKSVWVVPEEDCETSSCKACKQFPAIPTTGQAFFPVSKPVGVAMVRVSLHMPCPHSCTSLGSWNLLLFCSGEASKFPRCTPPDQARRLRDAVAPAPAPTPAAVEDDWTINVKLIPGTS